MNTDSSTENNTPILATERITKTNKYLTKMRDMYPEYTDVDDTTFALSFKDKHYDYLDDDEFLKLANIEQEQPKINSKDFNKDIYSDADKTQFLETHKILTPDEQVVKDTKEILFGNGEDFESKEFTFADDVVEPFKRSANEVAQNNIMAEAVMVIGDDANDPKKLKEFLDFKDKLDANSPTHNLQKSIADMEVEKQEAPHSVETFLEAVEKKGVLSLDTWSEFLKAVPSVTAGSVPNTVQAVINLPQATVSYAYKLAKDSLEADGIRKEPSRVDMAKSAPVATVIMTLDKFGFSKATASLKEEVAKAIVKNPAKKIADVMKSFSSTTINGIKYELPTEITQEIAEVVYVKDEATTGEDILKASVGAIMGTAGMTTGISTAKEVVSATKPNSVESILADEINKAVNGSSINEDALKQNVVESLSPDRAQYRQSTGNPVVDKVFEDFEKEIIGSVETPNEIAPTSVEPVDTATVQEQIVADVKEEAKPKSEVEKVEDGFKELEKELFADEESIETPKGFEASQEEEVAEKAEDELSVDEKFELEDLQEEAKQLQEVDMSSIDTATLQNMMDRFNEDLSPNQITNSDEKFLRSSDLIEEYEEVDEDGNVQQGERVSAKGIELLNKERDKRYAQEMSSSQEKKNNHNDIKLAVQRRIAEYKNRVNDEFITDEDKSSLEKAIQRDEAKLKKLEEKEEQDRRSEEITSNPLHVKDKPNKNSPLSHPRLNELLEMMEDVTSEDLKYPKRLVQKRTATSPALYTENPLFGFSLTKKDVKDIKNGNIDEKLLEKLDSDLGVLDNDPQWEQTKEPLHVKNEEVISTVTGETISEEDWNESDTVFMKNPRVKNTASATNQENYSEMFKGKDFTKESPKGQGAVDFLLEKKEGFVTGAFSHKIVGDIDLIWGTSKAGLKHIVERRTKQWGKEKTQRFLKHLADIVESGIVVVNENNPSVIELINPKSTAVVELEFSGTESHWLMSAYKDSSNKGKFKEIESLMVHAENSLKDKAIVTIAKNGTVSLSSISLDSIVSNKEAMSQEDKATILSMGLDDVGVNYVPTYESTGLPLRPIDGVITIGEQKVDLPSMKNPVNSEELLVYLKDIIGNRLYEQKIQNKDALGTYNRNNVSIRVKNRGAVEINAHEMAHYLDYFYKNKTGKAIDSYFKEFKNKHVHFLQTVSYTSDPKLSKSEGFAEFVRLWITNYNTLNLLDANAVKEFEKILATDETLDKKMRVYQREAHKFYYQGILENLRAKSGGTLSKEAKKVQRANNKTASAIRQKFIDKNHSAKLIQADLKNGVNDDALANAHKQLQLIGGADGTVDAVLKWGIPTTDVNGDITLDENQKSLNEIFEPVVSKGVEEVRLLETYFMAKRANELMAQGRENLISKEEIEAGLELEKTNPEFITIFDEFQAFNNAMLDFYVGMKHITQEQKESFLENNKNYVPFHRIKQSVQTGEVQTSVASLGQRLTGGTNLIGGIMDNIYSGVAKNIKDAYLSRAKSTLYTMLDKDKGGEYAVKIKPDSKKITLHLEEQAKNIATIMVELDIAITKDGNIIKGNKSNPNTIAIEDIEANLLLNPKTLEFWSQGHKPTSSTGYIDSAIIDGKKSYFEVIDPLLIETLNSQAGLGVSNPFLKTAMLHKNISTALTTNNPLFYITNAARDTVSASLLSENGFILGYHTLKGMVHFIMQDKVYKDFMTAGGGYGTKATALGQYDDINSNSIMSKHIEKTRTKLSLFQKILSGVMRAPSFGADAFEYGTRLGEFELAQKNGKSNTESAFSGREISTDFTIRGAQEETAKTLAIIAFAKAGINSIDKLTRTMFEVNGETKISNAFTFKDKNGNFLKHKRNFYLAGAGLTSLSLVLFMANKDDERYKRLTIDQKSRYWYIFPDLWGFESKEPWTIPKPHQIGAFFASIPEMVFQYAYDTYKGNKIEKEEYLDKLLFEFKQAGAVLDFPSVLKGAYDIVTNKDWRGVPIESMSLEKLQKEYRAKENTPELYKALGNEKLSPVQIQHLANSTSGLTGRMIDDAMEAFFWDKKTFGERPFAKTNPLVYLTQRIKGKEVEFRTKWDAKFYDIYGKSLETSATHNKLKKEARYSIIAREQAKKFIQEPENKIYATMTKGVRKIQGTLKNYKDAIEKISKSSKLTAEEKETMINQKLELKHKFLKNQVEKLEAYIEKKEKQLGIKKGS